MVWQHRLKSLGEARVWLPRWGEGMKIWVKKSRWGEGMTGLGEVKVWFLGEVRVLSLGEPRLPRCEYKIGRVWVIPLSKCIPPLCCSWSTDRCRINGFPPQKLEKCTLDHQEEAQGKNRINFSSSSKYYCSVSFLLGPMGKQVPLKSFQPLKISMFSIKADVRGQISVTESAEML